MKSRVFLDKLKIKRIFSMILLSFLLLPNFLPAKASTVDATLFFDPATVSSASVGSDFNLVARVNPGSNTTYGINAVELHVTFDPAVLYVNTGGITPSSAFGITFQAPAIDNTAGTASIIVMTSTPVTTISDVATFSFHAQAAGSTSVAFTNASNAADSEAGDLVVSTRTPSAVTVVAAPDSTAPVLSGGSPASALAAGTTETTVSVVTNENATCKYGNPNVIGVAYASMPNTFTTTGATNHSFVATGLENGGNYSYAVRCQDAAANATATDYLISFSVASASTTTTPTVSSSSNHDDNDSHHSSKKKKKTGKRKISNSKNKIKRGAVLTQRGKKFSKSSTVMLYFSKPGGGFYAPMPIKTTSSGAFIVKYTVTKPLGTYSWYALDTKTGKKSKIRYYVVK